METKLLQNRKGGNSDMMISKMHHQKLQSFPYSTIKSPSLSSLSLSSPYLLLLAFVLITSLSSSTEMMVEAFGTITKIGSIHTPMMILSPSPLLSSKSLSSSSLDNNNNDSKLMFGLSSSRTLDTSIKMKKNGFEPSSSAILPPFQPVEVDNNDDNNDDESTYDYTNMGAELAGRLTEKRLRSMVIITTTTTTTETEETVNLSKVIEATEGSTMTTTTTKLTDTGRQQRKTSVGILKDDRNAINTNIDDTNSNNNNLSKGRFRDLCILRAGEDVIESFFENDDEIDEVLKDILTSRRESLTSSFSSSDNITDDDDDNNDDDTNDDGKNDEYETKTIETSNSVETTITPLPFTETLRTTIISEAISSLQSLCILGMRAGLRATAEMQKKNVSHLLTTNKNSKKSTNYHASTPTTMFDNYQDEMNDDFYYGGDSSNSSDQGGESTSASTVATGAWTDEDVALLKSRMNVDGGVNILAHLKLKRSPLGAYRLLISMGVWSKHEELAFLRSGLPVRPTVEELIVARKVVEATKLAKSNNGNDDNITNVDSILNLRKDLTHLKTYTIDAAKTRDIDDGISLETIINDDGTERKKIWIHISDADKYAPRGSDAFKCATRRFSSVYLPSGTIGMFPPELGENVMSLERDCPALSLSVELDEDGKEFT